MVMVAAQQGVCGKCEGKGVIDAFSHIDNGVCYWCSGTGIVKTKAYENTTYTSQDRRVVYQDHWHWSFFNELTPFALVYGKARDGGCQIWEPKGKITIEQAREFYRAARAGKSPKSIGWICTHS